MPITFIIIDYLLLYLVGIPLRLPSYGLLTPYYVTAFTGIVPFAMGIA